MKRKILFFLCLLALLTACGKPAAPVPAPEPPIQEEPAPIPEAPAPAPIVLDRDGADGYDGDYVLIYNPDREGTSKQTGYFQDRIETGAAALPVMEREQLPLSNVYNDPDPCITPEILAQDDCYDISQGDAWTLGFQKVFHLSMHGDRLFRVTAVGETCRVWSPVNPSYSPLEVIDPAYPARLAQAADAAYPILEQYFGSIPDVRGDGKVNLICYDFNNASTAGVNVIDDLYGTRTEEGELLLGNGIAAIHLNTALVRQDEQQGINWLEECLPHELQHLRTMEAVLPEGLMEAYCARGENAYEYGQHIEGALWLTELLSDAASELVYPGSTLKAQVPYLYDSFGTWEDLAAFEGTCCLRNTKSEKMSGGSWFGWKYQRDDYSAMTLMAHFAENRGGPEVFPAILEKWQAMGCTGEPWQAVYECLGYEDFETFFEDFLLSMILHDSEFENGRYRLEPFGGCQDGENPFDLLVPMVTEKNLKLQPMSFTIIRPKDGNYIPPETADPGLQYVGIQLNVETP